MNSNRELTREELYEKLWSKATTQVAAELGVSDVALAKRCKKLNIPKPPLGYWAKVAAGQQPPKTPLPPEPVPVKYEPLNAPVERTLPPPSDEQSLHPVAAELKTMLSTRTPDKDNECVKADERTVPRVKVSKSQIDRTVKALHVILKAVEARGILFRKSRSKYEPAYFEQGSDRLKITIDEVLIARDLTPQERRHPGWQWRRPEKPSGKLVIELSPDQYDRRRDRDKKWIESDKLPYEEMLSKVVQAICTHYDELAKARAIAAEESRRRHEEWTKEQAEQNKRQHATNLEVTVQLRAEDLLKAAEWHRLYKSATDFINACEKRWKINQAGEVTQDQQSWLTWARDTAKGMSPFETGYPDPSKDGAFDPASVPFGGPYPPRRDFPRPPTMPKIPPLVQQTYSTHEHEPKQQYPFWLKYQRR